MLRRKQLKLYALYDTKAKAFLVKQGKQTWPSADAAKNAFLLDIGWHSFLKYESKYDQTKPAFPQVCESVVVKEILIDWSEMES